MFLFVDFPVAIASIHTRQGPAGRGWAANCHPVAVLFDSSANLTPTCELLPCGKRWRKGQAHRSGLLPSVIPAAKKDGTVEPVADRRSQRMTAASSWRKCPTNRSC